MPGRYPVQTRRHVLELAGSGTRGSRRLAETFGMSEATILGLGRGAAAGGPQRGSLRSLCGPAFREQPGTDENGRPKTPVFSRLSRTFAARFKVLNLRLFIGE